MISIYDFTIKYTPNGWKHFFTKGNDVIKCISDTIEKEKKSYKVYPETYLIWSSFMFTSLDKLKVVIIGQDPYPNQNARGLAFSTWGNMTSSLSNIFSTLERTVYGFKSPFNGDLSNWALQGVLLINYSFTVREDEPNSHKRLWKQFIDILVEYISDNKDNIVFMLLGKVAQEAKEKISKKKHYYLETSHPSGRSAEYGFSSCNIFNLCNKYLVEHNIEPIDWNL